jgi:hypothetical protein
MRRRWIGLVAALALLAFTNARAIDFDPNEVYDLVEPAWRVERAVRLVDARDTPSAAAQILPDGIRLGETQFRQAPPEASQAVARGLPRVARRAGASARAADAGARVRLLRFEFRFVQSGVSGGDVARAGLPAGSGEAVDLLLRSLTKGKAGVAQGIARIEVEAAGRPYVGNATSKLNATPTSATTRATFQAAVDDLVRALAADPDAASAEPPPSTKKRR